MADIVSTNCPLSTLTAKVESVGESGFDIEEGFPDDITSGITVTLADGETTKGIKDGDTVTFVGETHSQLWNKLYIDDAHIGAANGDNVINYHLSALFRTVKHHSLLSKRFDKFESF